MGRQMTTLRGHQLVLHGGDIDGSHSQVSYMPDDNIGIVVFVIGDQSQPMYNIITYNVYEMLLGLKPSPFSERKLKERDEMEKAEKDAKANIDKSKIGGTKPSHPINDYRGEYSNPLYGTVSVKGEGNDLVFNLNKLSFPLNHYHYDYFVTKDDEQFGRLGLNFMTNPQGDIGSIVISLDEGEVTYTRKADDELSSPAVLSAYTGTYILGSMSVDVKLKDGKLIISIPGQVPMDLLPYKPAIFKLKDFADITIEFMSENGKVVAVKQITSDGEYVFPKK